MEPGNNVPSGSWLTLKEDPNGDTMFIWPNNPGGLQDFSRSSSGVSDMILAEISGVPSTVTLDEELDTGTSMGDGGSGSLPAPGGMASQLGALELVYLDTGGATSASVAGWTSFGAG